VFVFRGALVALTFLLLAASPVAGIEFAVDWNRPGSPAIFITEPPTGVAFDALVIRFAGQDLRLTSTNGWGSFEFPKDGRAFRMTHDGKIETPHSFFFASGAQTYLVLVGEPTGCCDGDLTILAANARKPVFAIESIQLRRVVPLPDGIEVVTRGSSEARAPKNAWSYSPYRVYRIKGHMPARYDAARSRTYTEAHCVPWRGSRYDESYVEVQIDNHTCRTMSDTQFEHYRADHLARFR
jgi:hypothetical protein